jgi:hypothetical protein
LVVWNMTFFSYNYWECHHPNWRSVFFRGVGIPPTRYIIVYIIIYPHSLVSECW